MDAALPIARGSCSIHSRADRLVGPIGRAGRTWPSSIADGLPVVAPGGGIENLVLRTLRRAERRQLRRLNRPYRGRRQRTGRHWTDWRKIDAARTQRLHLAIDAATRARCLGGGGNEEANCSDQNETHHVPCPFALSRVAPHAILNAGSKPRSRTALAIDTTPSSSAML